VAEDNRLEAGGTVQERLPAADLDEWAVEGEVLGKQRTDCLKVAGVERGQVGVDRLGRLRMAACSQRLVKDTARRFAA
jgi:hypothetical protein